MSEVPMTQSELLHAIAQLLLGDSPEEVSNLDIKPLLAPAIMNSPHNIAGNLQNQLRMISPKAAAYVVKLTGVELVVLVDDLSGHVIAYNGGAYNEAPAYLIVRANKGLSWHAPLTPEEGDRASRIDILGDGSALITYQRLLPTVTRILGDFAGAIDHPLSGDQQLILTMLRRDLWLLENVARKDIEKIATFADIYLRLRGLLTSLGVDLDDLVNAMQRRSR